MVVPFPSDIEEGKDRMIVRLDPGGPIDLEGLGVSFAALARLYARHHGPTEDERQTPRLFIAKLENGSVVAEIVPYVVMLGQAVPYMQQAMVISNFTKEVAHIIRRFSGEASPPPPAPSEDDARDIRAFVGPLTGRRGAKLNITHARYERRDGKKVTLLEYKFDENELNRAATGIDAQLAGPLIPEFREIKGAPTVKEVREAMLFFEQANRGLGKSSGRTGDRVTIPSISDKALPAYFRKDAGLKEQMVQGQPNPLKDAAFVVDVEVQMVDGEPRGYLITHVHEVLDGS